MANACGLETTLGMSFQVEDPSDDTYKAVTSFSTVPQHAWTAGTAQCQVFDSPGGWAEYYKNGRFDQAEQQFVLNFKEGDVVHQLLQGSLTTVGTNEALKFRITFANTGASQIDWDAMVTGWGVTIPTDSAEGADNLLQLPITLRPTGQPTWTE